MNKIPILLFSILFFNTKILINQIIDHKKYYEYT